MWTKTIPFQEGVGGKLKSNLQWPYVQIISVASQTPVRGWLQSIEEVDTVIQPFITPQPLKHVASLIPYILCVFPFILSVFTLHPVCIHHTSLHSILLCCIRLLGASGVLPWGQLQHHYNATFDWGTKLVLWSLKAVTFRHICPNLPFLATWRLSMYVTK